MGQRVNPQDVVDFQRTMLRVSFWLPTVIIPFSAPNVGY